MNEQVLDDGSELGDQKPFDNGQYDKASRTFTGCVRWLAAPFSGDRLWRYTIVFSEDFNAIEAGAVRAYAVDNPDDGAPPDRYRSDV